MKTYIVGLHSESKKTPRTISKTHKTINKKDAARFRYKTENTNSTGPGEPRGLPLADRTSPGEPKGSSAADRTSPGEPKGSSAADRSLGRPPGWQGRSPSSSTPSQAAYRIQSNNARCCTVLFCYPQNRQNRGLTRRETNKSTRQETKTHSY